MREFLQGVDEHLANEGLNALGDHGEEAAVAGDGCLEQIGLALLVEVEVIKLVPHVMLHLANRVMNNPQQSLHPLTPAPQQIINLV